MTLGGCGCSSSVEAMRSTTPSRVPVRCNIPECQDTEISPVPDNELSGSCNSWKISSSQIKGLTSSVLGGDKIPDFDAFLIQCLLFLWIPHACCNVKESQLNKQQVLQLLGSRRSVLVVKVTSPKFRTCACISSFIRQGLIAVPNRLAHVLRHC